MTDLALPLYVFLAPVVVLATLAAVFLASLWPVRQIRHESQPGPIPAGVTWLDDPGPEPPPGVVLQDIRMVPDSGACAIGACDHRSHRLRPATRPVPYPPASARAGAR